MDGWKTLAQALEEASNPARGFAAFIAWCLSLPNMGKFFLVRRMDYFREARECTWLKDLGGDGWETNSFSITRKQPDDEILETVYAESFEALDWKKSSFYIPDGVSGWLSPEGEFWGCRYGGHCNLAHYVLKMDYGVMEQRGWCHVDEAGRKGKKTYRSLKTLTPAQELWLEKNGHDMDPYGDKARKREAETIKLGVNGEYTIDAKADKEAFERMMARAPKR